MTKLIDLLKNRRIWAGIVGVVAFLLPSLGLDVPVVTDLLTKFGENAAGIITAGLSLWSYFQPKK